VSAAVLAVMLYRGLADPEPGQTLSLDTLGWAILICACGGLAISIALAAYSRFLLHSAEYSRARAGPEQPEAEPPAETVEGAPKPSDLQMLPEDEKRIMEIIEASGGEILQMKIVSSGEFSKSKVTRLLDKLEGRELIKRERHGMTNMVRLTKKP